MKDKWAFIFHTVFIWVMYVAMFWATVPAIDTFDVPFGAVLVGFIAGGFSIAATNGGIGLYPVAVAGAFALFGIPEEPANAFGWIMWTAQNSDDYYFWRAFIFYCYLFTIRINNFIFEVKIENEKITSSGPFFRRPNNVCAVY